MAGEESVLKSREPLVFRNALDNWKVFHWTFDDWTHFFRGQPLKFRVGSKKCSKEPQWERSSRTTTMTLDEFKNLAVEDSDSWYYFDYKHLNEYCDHDTSFLDDINWSCVGLPERSGKDSTLWIGSKGAHTPCHIDTYGCNFVAQIFGRKRWLLFPPDTVQLKPSRIPYEESSIYTHINFQCSRNYDPKLIEKAFSVELDPGDVLFVPPQWWHYVENLSTAISINTWVPMATDNLARLKECLVRFLVTTIKPTLTSEMCLELLNPNEDDIESSAECLEKLSHCITQLPVGHQNDSEDQGESLVKKRKFCHLNFKAVERISKEQIDNLMNSCSCDGTDDQQKDLPLVFSLVNSFCEEKVLDNVSQNLLSHYT